MLARNRAFRFHRNLPVVTETNVKLLFLCSTLCSVVLRRNYIANLYMMYNEIITEGICNGRVQIGHAFEIQSR